MHGDAHASAQSWRYDHEEAYGQVKDMRTGCWELKRLR